MRKLMLILAILLSFAVVASAEVPSPLSFYAGGAFSMPNGPTAFKDAYKTGYHGWIGAGYTVAPTFQVVGKIEHNHFAFDNGSFTGVEGGSMKIWMYGADAKFSPKVPTFPIKPFMFAGAGWASSKISEFTGSNTLATAVLNEGTNQTVTKMYWNIGAGADIFSGPAFSVFLQGRWVSIQTEGSSTSFIPVSMGVRFF
jgi:hypothetical protein